MPAKEPEPTGVAEIDLLDVLDPPQLEDYLVGVAAYVRLRSTLSVGQAKAAQIRLSRGLARALLVELQARLPMLEGVAAERTVAGALRRVQADVSESDSLDGLRLAVELKPVNLAVGRAIWNRFGDIRTFAVNLHLKFPFAVVGGVLVFPTWEEQTSSDGQVTRKPTTHLISRAIGRLRRAGGRITEGDAPHLLEGVGVVVYDPDTGLLDPDLPPVGSGLRWDEFVTQLVSAYEARFIE